MASKRAYPEGALNRSYTNLKQTTDGIKWECTSCASAETWPRHEHNELVDMEITGFLCDGKRGLLYGTFYDKEGTGTSGAFVKESGGQWKKSSTELGLLYGNRDAFVPRPIGGEWYLNNNGGDIIAGIQWDATASFDLAQSYFFLSIPSTPQKRPVLTDLDINHGRGLVVGYNNDTLRGADPIGPLAYFHMSGKVQKTKDRNAAYKEWTAASPPCTNCLLYSGAMIGTSTALVGAADWDATKRTSTGFALYKTTDLGKSWKKVASTTKPGNMSDIWTPQYHSLLAEVAKVKGRKVVVALPPGRYILQWRRSGGVYHAKITLQKGKLFRLGTLGKRLAYWKPSATRGSDAPNAGLWSSFQGQLVGLSLSASYRAGWSGLDRGVFHQGASLQALFPQDLLGLGLGRMSFLIQSGYQTGAVQINDNLGYQLHLLDLDLGALWTLLERPHWWMALGGLIRGTWIIQELMPKDGRPQQSIQSGSFAAAALFSVQVGFASRWFLQFNLLAGPRCLHLGATWAVRWELDATLGLGLRL